MSLRKINENILLRMLRGARHLAAAWWWHCVKEIGSAMWLDQKRVYAVHLTWPK